MTPFRLRSPAAVLAILVLAACGAAQESAAAESSSAPPESPVPPPAPGIAQAPAPARSAAAAGYYECYFHGDYGLQNSSMTSMRIHGPAEYEAMEAFVRHKL